MEIYWIWLSTLPYIGPVLQKRLIQAFHTPDAVYKANEIELYTIERITQKAVTSILEHRSLERAKRIKEQLYLTHTQLLTFDSPFYKESAKQCKQSPIVLYYKGQLRTFDKAVTVVGSRRCTDYGKSTAKQIATSLADRQVPVISGLAKGIDAYAHTATLKNNGYTLAFVANGVDWCYPKEHDQLHQAITKKGAVVSQHPPGTQPKAPYFVQRNALMSAWSSHVIVVEAGHKSGALTTADYARQQQRQLFTVPHRIDMREGEGTNQLLNEGAQPYLNISSLGIKAKSKIQLKQPTANKTTNENHDSSRIIDKLQKESLSIPLLANRLNQSTSDLFEELFALELEGKVLIRGDRVERTS